MLKRKIEQKEQYWSNLRFSLSSITKQEFELIDSTIDIHIVHLSTLFAKEEFNHLNTRLTKLISTIEKLKQFLLNCEVICTQYLFIQKLIVVKEMRTSI